MIWISNTMEDKTPKTPKTPCDNFVECVVDEQQKETIDELKLSVVNCFQHHLGNRLIPLYVVVEDLQRIEHSLSKSDWSDASKETLDEVLYSLREHMQVDIDRLVKAQNGLEKMLHEYHELSKEFEYSE